MKEVKIKFEIDTDDAEKDLNKVDNKTKDIGESAKKSKKGFASMSKGIKGVGTALKASGIGLIVAVIAGLTEAFSRNKKVMDAVSITMNTIQNVFSQIADALVNVYDSVTKTSENFDALGKVIVGLITVGFAPLKIAFYGIIATAEALKLAYENMFGDEESIAKAQANLDETNEKLKEIAIETKQAGKDIVENIGEAIDEVVVIGTTAIDELGKVNIKSANEQAKAYKNATDSAILAQSQTGALIAKYERQSELQRQLRDDTSKSVDERIRANNELGDILDKQEEQMLRQADLVIASARAELLKNDSIENQALLIDALAQKEQVRSDIAGKRSEQIVNETGLLKEKYDLENAISEGIDARNKKQLEFEAEQETDPLKKLEMQKEALDAENEAILEDLERKRELYAEGTAERLQAEEEYKNAKQDIDNAITLNEKEALAKRKENEAIANAKKIEDAKAVEDAKIQLANMGLNVLASLAKEGSDLAKGIAVAQTTISTYQGIMSALSATTTIPEPFGQALKVANAISVGVAGAVNVQKILATKPVETSAPNIGDIGGRGATQAPSFNLVEGSADSQIQNSIQNAGDTPLRAYVVAQDVTSQQSLDRQIESNSGI